MKNVFIALIVQTLFLVGCLKHEPVEPPKGIGEQSSKHKSTHANSSPPIAELYDDELIFISSSGQPGPSLPEAFESLTSSLQNLFGFLLGITNGDRNSNQLMFRELIIQIRTEDPEGEETSNALIQAYTDSGEYELAEKTKYVNLLGYLVSEHSVLFLHELAASEIPANLNLGEEECNEPISLRTRSSRLRVVATESLYYIAGLLDSEDAKNALFDLAENASLYHVREEATLSLRQLGYSTLELSEYVRSEEQDFFFTIQFQRPPSLEAEEEPYEPYEEPEDQEPNN